LKEGKRIIAAKVAHYKSINLNRQKKQDTIITLASKGIVSLALDTLIMQKVVTQDQQELPFHFVGLVVLILLNETYKA
jgi:hypothetical protein